MSVLVLIATFLAASVEWVEALTIVLAVGTVKGWRSALVGVGLGLVALVALVAVFGVTVTAIIPVAAARTVVGVFLLLFGLKWLHKAILRSSGLKSLHDEAKAFEETRLHLVAAPQAPAGDLDWIGVTTSLNGVFLEGLEVVFIVIALGGLHSLPTAAAAAVASLIVVVGAGVALRHPLTRIPENTLKYVVGIMLTSFGTFFVGEGIGVNWWRADLSLLPLIAVYLLASLVFVQLLKRPPRLAGLVASSEHGVMKAIRTTGLELWGLFVDDSALALIAAVVVLACALFVSHAGPQGLLASILLVVGILVAVSISLAGALPGRRAKVAPVTSGPDAVKREGVAS
jgi:uncharacterized membrane protein